MRYLDPKADLTFKKVFGEHPDLVISLLNALLPLDGPEEKIVQVEYLPAELVPETPLKKNSIVDVRAGMNADEFLSSKCRFYGLPHSCNGFFSTHQKPTSDNWKEGKNTNCYNLYIHSAW